MLKLLFPGSFDPFTKGHADLVCRALTFADQVVVAIGVHPEKHNMFTASERTAQIRQCFEGDERVKVVSYSGLTTDLAREQGANAILRGIRSVSDFEYERAMADVNHQLTGIETVILIADPKYAAISSSVVRELLKYKKDVSAFLP